MVFVIVFYFICRDSEIAPTRRKRRHFRSGGGGRGGREGGREGGGLRAASCNSTRDEDLGLEEGGVAAAGAAGAAASNGSEAEEMEGEELETREKREEEGGVWNKRMQSGRRAGREDVWCVCVCACAKGAHVCCVCGWTSREGSEGVRMRGVGACVDGKNATAKTKGAEGVGSWRPKRRTGKRRESGEGRGEQQ